MQNEIKVKEAAHARAVRDMFSRIAGRYDLLNHVLSLNIDKRWRRIVADELRFTLNDPKALVLDVACGTGDLAIELNKDAQAAILATDFCRPMLSVAQTKNENGSDAIPYIEADALVLPFGDDSFDAVTIAFGLRNLANIADGLAELSRILKAGGTLAVLEFSAPIVPGFGQLFNFYFSHILPRIGGLVSGSRGAYEYLPDSVSKFPNQKKLAGLMAATGLTTVKYKNLTGGIAALHTGVKN